MTQTAPFRFRWDLLGDLNEGRPTLGTNMRVEVYRLMLFTLRDVLEQRLGTEQTTRLLFEAGAIAGWEFAERYIGRSTDLSALIARMHTVCREMGIGIVTLEQADPDGKEFTITVAEDLDCSGIPNIHRTICQTDEGFITALLEYATAQKYLVREVDCWASGTHTCRFVVRHIS